MKREKSASFAKKCSDIITLKTKFIVKNHCRYTAKHRGAAHSICNLKYITPKELLTMTRTMIINLS